LLLKEHEGATLIYLKSLAPRWPVENRVFEDVIVGAAADRISELVAAPPPMR
jgi:hypothetical protein